MKLQSSFLDMAGAKQHQTQSVNTGYVLKTRRFKKKLPVATVNPVIHLYFIQVQQCSTRLEGSLLLHD